MDAESGAVTRTRPMLIIPARVTRRFEVQSARQKAGRSAPPCA
jgi:hypothetical protein